MITGSARRPGGYATWTGEHGIEERDSLTCSHCNTVHFVKPRCPVNEAPDLCRMCMRMICPPCAERMARGDGCVPFEKRCDELERRDRFRRQLGVG